MGMDDFSMQLTTSPLSSRLKQRFSTTDAIAFGCVQHGLCIGQRHDARKI
jgi:hypothetical protein